MAGSVDGVVSLQLRTKAKYILYRKTRTHGWVIVDLNKNNLIPTFTSGTAAFPFPLPLQTRKTTTTVGLTTQ
jgi:hypothetical protein